MTVPTSASSVLVIDAGNTRTKWAVCSAEHQFGTPFEAGGVFINAALPDAVIPEVWRNCRRAVIASVASLAVMTQIETMLQTLAIDVDRVNTTAQACQLQNGYAEPLQLGVDRWLAAIAAWRHCQAPCIVACAGTALTVDAVDAGQGIGQGLLLGGLIIPGFRLMQHSLLEGTAAIGTAAIYCAGCIRLFGFNQSKFLEKICCGRCRLQPRFFKCFCNICCCLVNTGCKYSTPFHIISREDFFNFAHLFNGNDPVNLLC